MNIFWHNRCLIKATKNNSVSVQCDICSAIIHLYSHLLLRDHQDHWHAKHHGTHLKHVPVHSCYLMTVFLLLFLSILYLMQILQFCNLCHAYWKSDCEWWNIKDKERSSYVLLRYFSSRFHMLRKKNYDQFSHDHLTVQICCRLLGFWADRQHETGGDWLIMSFMICTPYHISFGW